MQSDKTFILITRKTRLQELVERFNSWSQAKFYLEHNQTDVADYVEEDQVYQAQIKKAEAVLRQLGRFQRLDRTMLPNYRFGQQDVIVVIGQDGLVANTMKYLSTQPVIAINPDPERWDGKLLPFRMKDLNDVVNGTIQGDTKQRRITFAELTTNDGQRMRAVNDLFVGPKSHTSARYTLSWQGKHEKQSSSGIIISTGFGSTGWFQSILAGAMGVSGIDTHPMQQGFEWDAPNLQFAVREPFPSQTSDTTCVFGAISTENQLVLESHMPENGVIFSDGIEQDCIQFNAGSIATISTSEHAGRLIVG